MREGTTEYAMFRSFDSALHPYASLSNANRLCNPDLPFAISIVFGETDWMDSRGSKTIVSSSKFFQQGQSMLHILPNSGHQMAMGNPTGLCKLIADDLLGRVSHVWQPQLPTTVYVDTDENLIPNPEDLLEVVQNEPEP